LKGCVWERTKREQKTRKMKRMVFDFVGLKVTEVWIEC